MALLTTLDLTHERNVAHLRELPDLRTLYLGGNEISDDAAEHLCRLPNPTKLSIGQRALTDRFAVDVRSMTQYQDKRHGL